MAVTASKTSDFVLDNWRRIWFLFLWLVLNISLFAWKFYQYKRRSAFEMMGYCVLRSAHAATYASLIMEELDPDHNGCIEVPTDLLNFNQD